MGSPSLPPLAPHSTAQVTDSGLKKLSVLANTLFSLEYYQICCYCSLSQFLSRSLLSLPRSIPPSSLSPPPPQKRHRLKEGFHITRAQSGVITLTAQLSASQPSSPRDLLMLLQYIIFPLNSNPAASTSSFSAVATGYPTSELWVEPQYGTVTQAPAGLQYILGCKHTEIADKVIEAVQPICTCKSKLMCTLITQAVSL